MEIKDYTPANWFTSQGLRLKRAQIERKGIPDLTNWRFVTLTIDPNEFEDELAAYKWGTDYMRRFVDKLRVAFEGRFQGGELKQCNKLEFHSEGSENEGWPHWHMALNLTHRMSYEEMQLVSMLWGKGRVNFRRIEGSSLDYFFKYVFKSPVSGLSVPDWFADYFEAGKTFSRVRFWKTSQTFYTGKPPKQREQSEKKTCLIPETVREKHDRWMRSVILVSRNVLGEYTGAQVTELIHEKDRLFVHLANLVTRGKAVSPYTMQFKTGSEQIEHHIPKWHRQTNKPLLRDRQRVKKQPPLPSPAKCKPLSTQSLKRNSRKARDYVLKV